MISKRKFLKTGVGLLISFNIIVFIITVVTAGLNFTDIYGCGASPFQVFIGEGVSSLQCELGQINYLVLYNFQYWQIFTSMFVHFGIVHLTLNMIALFYFGSIIEMNYGKKNLLLIYFLSGIIGNIASLFLLPLIFGFPNGDFVLSGGASGAIFGLIGAFAILGKISGSFYSALIYVIAIFIMSSFIPGVNIIAHLFGLVSGTIISYLFTKYYDRRISLII